MVAQTLGARIAQARRELGVRTHRDVSPSDVAEALGVSPATVYRWESDEKSPREDALAKLSTYLGVTPAYLRYGVQPGAIPEILRGARKLTEEELDRADVIAARAKQSTRQPAAKKRANGGKRGGAA
jgi:transcriptional regulator with XRE-family HTH domain